MLTGGWLRNRWWMVCLRVSQTCGPLVFFSGRSCRSGSSPTLHVITWRCCTMFATEAVLAALLTVARRCKFLCMCVCDYSRLYTMLKLFGKRWIREGWQVQWVVNLLSVILKKAGSITNNNITSIYFS